MKLHTLPWTASLMTMFRDLRAHGITVFFPTFQSQEAGESKSLGFETDFIPPCNAHDPAFEAMRKTGMKLMVPAEIFYQPGVMPSLENDPLKELIACAGREHIYAVDSYDEPAFRDFGNTTLLSASRELYKRVKEVDPSLPVYMVHAPIVTMTVDDATGKKHPLLEEEVAYYLQEVEKYTPYADVIGFDVYPIPLDVAEVGTPYTMHPVGYDEVVSDYVRWLREHTKGKPYFMALQAFAYEDLGKNPLLDKSADPTRKPTKEELESMVRAVRDGGGAKVIWWGESMLNREDEAFWNTVLEVSKEAVGR